MIVKVGLKMRAKAAYSVREELMRNSPVTFGRHVKNGENTEVVRYRTVKDGKSRWIELSITSPKGRKLIPIAKRHALLKKMACDLKAENREFYAMLRASENVVGLEESEQRAENKAMKYSYEEFCALEEKKDPNIKTGYRHGSRVFRSKSEMLIAQMLDNLGLEYKYEPVIRIKGEERWPDFAVYCPETRRYFFIEHLGMMDRVNYRLENLEKMMLYESCGIRNGVDIIYTTEFGQGTFVSSAVMGKIAGIILAQAVS